MTDWHLRPTLADDISALQRMGLRDADAAQLYARLRQNGDMLPGRLGVGLVAVLPDESVIGFGRVTFRPRAAEIGDLFVDAAWRRRGIGSAIITRLIGAARDMAATKVEIGAAVRNSEALNLYRRLGFRPWRTTALDLESGIEPVLYLVQSLRSSIGPHLTCP